MEESSALTWRRRRRVLAVVRWPDETKPLLGARLRRTCCAAGPQWCCLRSEPVQVFLIFSPFSHNP
jgi:hypothetical protein